MSYKVFISYTMGDNWEAYSIAKELRELGANVFLDSLAIDFGENFEQKILDNLRDCNELWVLVTPKVQLFKLNQELGNIKHGSMDRPYVWLETGTAWYRGIPIVPLLKNISISELMEDKDIPILIKSRRCVEMANINEYIGLLESVKIKIRGNRRMSQRKPINPPIEFKFVNGEKCGTARLIERSVDGRGCFIATEDSIDMNSAIDLSFNASIKHHNARQLDRIDVKGIGVRLDIS